MHLIEVKLENNREFKLFIPYNRLGKLFLK